MVLLKSILDAILALKDIVSGVRAIAGFIQENRDEAWFKASAQVFNNLKKASEDETLSGDDRSAKFKEAGAAIRDILNGL